MTVRARAPGKLVVLGEYAVMDGAPALVMAVDRYCRAAIRPARGGLCRIETRAPARRVHRFEPGRPSGVALVDLITGPAPPAGAWRGVLDCSALFAGGVKLGLGSSAAALCAWAAAWAAFAPSAAGAPTLERLIQAHRRLQGGAGSGLDVAACCTGGVIRYRLGSGGAPRVGSVRLPNSVGFAGIFAGRAASTPDLVTRYRAWERERPRQAAAFRRQLGGVAEAGCAAVAAGDPGGLLAAIAEYGRRLDALGEAIGVAIVTDAHRAIGAEAERLGVAYKVSGAGGGDLGLAFSDRPDALAAFKAAVSRTFRVLDLGIDRVGVFVEEPTQ